MLKLAVFTVMLPDLTPEAAAPALRDSGYDGVEWRVTTIPESKRGEAPSFWGNNLCTLGLDEAARARDAAAAAGLATPGLGTYIEVGDLATVEAAMQFAQVCGARQIRVGSGRWPQPGVSYAAAYAAGRAFLEGAGALARQYNIKALIEIHHNTISSSAALAHRLVDGLDPAYVGVLHDCGNMVHEGYEEYRMGIELLGPYLAHVHVKNAAWTRPPGGGVWTSGWAPLEDGVVNFTALFTALRDAGYTGWVGLEDFSGVRPTLDALRHNHDFLREIMVRVWGD